MQSSSESKVVWLSRMLRHIILVTAMLLLLYRTLCIVLQRLQYGESSVEKQQQQRNNKNSSESESERDKLKCRELQSTQDHQNQDQVKGESEGELVSCFSTTGCKLHSMTDYLIHHRSCAV